MSVPTPIISEAEGLVHQLADELTRPREGECLCCYVARQLDEYPCDGTHRHAFRYRDARAPRATALAQRMRDIGACCCDCEIFMNGYQLDACFWTPEREVVHDGGGTVILDAKQPEQLPPCAGVRRGSTRPCTNWVRRRRGW
jgi:hypothetical protein